MTKDYLERQFKNYYEITGDTITPQMFGAKGDGVTDDTTAIQSAINAVHNDGGGTVFFPKGTYKVSLGIVVLSNVTLFGEKGESIIVVDQTIQQNGTVITIGDVTAATESTNNVNLNSLIFRGSETYGAPEYGIRIMEIWHSTNVSITDCLFQNNLNGAIKLIQSSNIKVFNTRFEATDCGIITQGNGPTNDITVRDCYFTGVSSYNNFTNYYSECISLFCGHNNVDPCERWRIENCIFEHKKTTAILIGAQSATSGSGHIANKDCIVRNCTFSAILTAVSVTESESIVIDGIYYDDAIKQYEPQTINSVLTFKSSKNVKVQNVISRCTQINRGIVVFDDTYNSNIMIDGLDAIMSGKESANVSILFATGSGDARNDNITIKNAILRENPNITTKLTAIQYSRLTNSNIDITHPSGDGITLQHYLPSAVSGTVSNNRITINTLSTTVRGWADASTSVADSNKWILEGDGVYNVTKVSNGFNQSRLSRTYNVKMVTASDYNDSQATANFYLVNDGYEFFIEFESTTYTNGKTFTFNNTGNIIPIDQPFTFSNDYKVVCHFVQKNAKWVEVERILEYYEGANVNESVLTKVAILPTASATELGNTYIYIGANDTTARLIHGAIYTCVSDGASTPTYQWSLDSIPLQLLQAALANSTTFDDFKALFLNS